MTDLSALPAEVLREILIHAVSFRGFKRALRLRLVNKEFSQEVKNALYQSHVLKDAEKGWRCNRPESLEPDAFWQPYLTNKIIRKEYTNVNLCGRIYCIAERLCQMSYPQGISKDTSHEVIRQYISAYCRQFRRVLARTRFMSLRMCPFNESLYFLEMALVNDCQEGVRSALQDPVLSDMISNSCSPPTYHCLADLAQLAGERGDIVLLAQIFQNPNFQQKPEVVRRRAFQGAMSEARLDVARFIIEPCRHLPEFDPVYWVDSQNLVTGMLRSRSVDFCSQLLGLLTTGSEKADNTIRRHFGYDKLLSYVAYTSPQRVDVAEWLLEQGALVQRQAHIIKIRREDIHVINSWNPIMRAVKGGNEQILRLLLDHGADARVGENDTLKEAVKQGRLDMVRILVEYGARITARFLSTCDEDNTKWRKDWLMALAVLSENEDLCWYLMEHGAILNNRALESAIKASLVSMVQLLLDLRADVTEGMIASAERLGHAELATLLREHRDGNRSRLKHVLLVG